MENRESFFARIQPVLSPTDILRVEVAYDNAKHAHRWQERKDEFNEDGTHLRYFEHLRRVALIAVDEARVLNPDIIISCLMHDVLEDTETVHERMLEYLFGGVVAVIVKQCTKDPKEGFYDRLVRYGRPEAFFVKACDRIDNLRSLGNSSEEFRKKQMKETREVVIPALCSGNAYANMGSLDRPYTKLIRTLEELTND